MHRLFRANRRPVFVTVATYHHRRWLQDDYHVELLMDAMRRVSEVQPFRHIAHAVLPDHVHWLFEPLEGRSSFDIVSAVKRDVTWALKQNSVNGFPPYWQYRFADHVVRDDADLGRHVDYVHFDAVRHGVAACAADHPYSSFRDWRERGAYAADWGRAEPATIRGLDLG